MKKNEASPPQQQAAQEKQELLRQFFLDHPQVGLAFSGGVDSAYLLWAASQWAALVRPYYLAGPFQPAWEREEARLLAQQLGCRLTELEVSVLDQPQIRANDGLRCYYCKRLMLGRLLDQAQAQGLPLLLDGNNASDPYESRPGMRAGQELGVVSPLRLCGLTKEHIRQLSRQAGLFTWDKPSYSCLATRVATGQKLLAQDLQRIEAGENLLRQLGFSDFRLRLQGETALLQVTAGQLEQAQKLGAELLNRLGQWFPRVSLDERPRPDSL